MPHALGVPYSGFQAVILCGPGVSLNTFTANPEEYPKALVPIANRPMVWYPLDWCYRMGITNIHLITPPSSLTAIRTALAQNPHLTSLPTPKPSILSPPLLSQNTPTAEILRDPEVHSAITGDFLVLSCDLVCELPGESLLEAWMIQQGALGSGLEMGLGGECSGRRGGLGVWFETKGPDCTKGTETDFVITTSLPSPSPPPPSGSLRPHISKLLYATTTDTLRDVTEEKKGFPIRHGMIRKHGKIRMLTTHRDAHIYLFPHWVLEYIRQNESFDSISEDVVGWWAKASWQDGLGDKLCLRRILDPSSTSFEDPKDDNPTKPAENSIENSIDLLKLSSTQTSTLPTKTSIKPSTKSPSLTIPPILSYIHPTTTSPDLQRPTPLIRRVDTPALLLSTSLHLATLPPTPEPLSTPLSHPQKISPLATIASQTTIHAPTVLIAASTTISTHSVIKASVIGSNCTIGVGARLTNCLLMDGAVVEEKSVLQGCILGRRAVVGKGCQLRECEVQEGFRVEEGTEGKGEKFCVFEGLEAVGEEEEDDDDDEGAGDGGGEGVDSSADA